MSRSCVLFALLVLCVAAFGQRGFFGTTARMMLVMTPDVKKELKLTKAQDKQIQNLLLDLQKEGAAGMLSGGFDMSNPMGGMDPKLVLILNDVQKLRMEELFIQANAGFALTDPKVAVAVALTEDQNLQIKTINDEANEVVQKLMMEARSNAALKAVKEKRKEFAEKIKALLTPEQGAKFVALQGKPFKFKD